MSHRGALQEARAGGLELFLHERFVCRQMVLEPLVALIDRRVAGLADERHLRPRADEIQRPDDREGHLRRINGLWDFRPQKRRYAIFQPRHFLLRDEPAYLILIGVDRVGELRRARHERIGLVEVVRDLQREGNLRNPIEGIGEPIGEAVVREQVFEVRGIMVIAGLGLGEDVGLVEIVLRTVSSLIEIRAHQTRDRRALAVPADQNLASGRNLELGELSENADARRLED